jgi:hypothetical protein
VAYITYYHPHLCAVTERVTKQCDACQKQKLVGPRYGQLPSRNAGLIPWEEVAIDLIGPWMMVKLPNETFDFMALTCIDPVTSLRDKTASHVGVQFENLWLSRYP